MERESSRASRETGLIQIVSDLNSYKKLSAFTTIDSLSIPFIVDGYSN